MSTTIAHTSGFPAVAEPRIDRKRQHSKNNYLLLEGDQWIDLSDWGSEPLGFGRDYYREVLRLIEASERFQGFTFYLSKEAPGSLPTVGKDVVLLIIGDEHYRYFGYFLDIFAIVRCYGTRPQYLDGWRVDSVGISALFMFLFKTAEHWQGVWRATRFRALRVREVCERTLHVPLGCFEQFNPDSVPMAQRACDFGFLGSIDYRPHPWYSIRGWIRPSKYVSRVEMMKVLSKFAAGNGQWQSTLSVTDGFQDSISKLDSYVRAMENCKISLCPRGSNQETYRFYEACKSGCVVICEPLPATWFYEGNPGLVINDWDQIDSVLADLLSNRARLEGLSAASERFWHSNLSEEATAKKITSFLLDLQARSR